MAHFGRPVLRSGSLIAGALLIAGPAAAQDSVPRPAELAERIDAYVAPLREADQLSGVLLVARGDSVLYERAWGWADRARRVPNTPGTPSAVASLTKPLTVILAHQLVRAGLLSPADTIARWLPDFPRANRITVEQLLTHRAGIPHRVTTAEDERVPQSAASMAALAAAAEPLGEPGADRVYSSAGYSVAARVLELAAGRPYHVLLDSLVLRPAGAVHSLDASGGRPSGAALAYLTGVDSLLPGPGNDLSFLVGAGSLYATPRDLFRVIRHLLRGGYGEVARTSIVGADGFHSNGITDGYRAFADYSPGDSLLVILVANRFTGATDLLRRDVPVLARGGAAAPELPAFEAVALTEGERRDLEGTYRVGGAPGEVEFVTPSLALFGSWTLIATGPSTFFSPQDYATVTAVRDDTGAVTGLQWGKAGQGPLFTRVTPSR